ncbi:UGT3A1 [Scenedesmus sp. PABB004]|nr:UGT3A1 [Scenedesmus sp. PABB004]
MPRLGLGSEEGRAQRRECGSPARPSQAALELRSHVLAIRSLTEELVGERKKAWRALRRALDAEASAAAARDEAHELRYTNGKLQQQLHSAQEALAAERRARSQRAGTTAAQARPPAEASAAAGQGHVAQLLAPAQQLRAALAEGGGSPLPRHGASAAEAASQRLQAELARREAQLAQVAQLQEEAHALRASASAAERRQRATDDRLARADAEAQRLRERVAALESALRQHQRDAACALRLASAGAHGRRAGGQGSCAGPDQSRATAADADCRAAPPSPPAPAGWCSSPGAPGAPPPRPRAAATEPAGDAAAAGAAVAGLARGADCDCGTSAARRRLVAVADAALALIAAARGRGFGAARGSSGRRRGGSGRCCAMSAAREGAAGAQQRCRRRFLFISVPDHGHAGPLLGVALALVGAGHEVDFASLDDAAPRLEPRLAAAGARWVGLGPDPRGAEELRALHEAVFNPSTPPREALAATRETFEGYATYMAPRLLDLADSGSLPRPDCVVIDIITFAGYDVAEKFGAPLVVMGSLPLNFVLQATGHDAYNRPQHVPYESLSICLPERMSALQRHVVNPLLKRLMPDFASAAFRPGRAAQRAALGLPPLPAHWPVCAAPPGVRAVYLAGVSFATDTARPLPANFHVVGPTGTDFSAASGFPPPLPPGRVADFVAAGRGTPLVYVAFGTMVRLSPPQVSTLAAGLGGLLPHARLIWSLKPDAAAHLPPGWAEQAGVLVSDWLPQPALLGQPGAVSLFVSHGGQNSINEGFAAGKPILCMPFGGDQFVNAQHVVNKGMGLALRLTPGLPPAAITAAALRVLREPAFAATAAAVGEAMRGASGPATAVARIEEFLAAAGDDGESAAPDGGSGRALAAPRGAHAAAAQGRAARRVGRPCRAAAGGHLAAPIFDPADVAAATSAAWAPPAWHPRLAGAREGLERAVAAYYEDVWNDGALELLEGLVTPGVVHSDVLWAVDDLDLFGRGSLRAMIADFQAGHPLLRFELERVAVDERSRVAVAHYTATAAHLLPGADGAPATGAVSSVAGLDKFCFDALGRVSSIESYRPRFADEEELALLGRGQGGR